MCRELTASIILPDVENNSPAISISTVVTAPTAGCETHARKWRTTSSYNLWEEKISLLLMTEDYKMTIYKDQNEKRKKTFNTNMQFNRQVKKNYYMVILAPSTFPG